MSKGYTVKEPEAHDDKTLIRDFKAGNIRAFDLLVMRYKDRVFGLCVKIMADYDEADECAQEVFIKMYRNITTYRGEAAFSTWLYRIAVNTCKNRIGSVKRRRTSSIDRADGPGKNPGPMDIRDTSWDPHGMFERSEKQQRIYAALNELPSRERIFIVLKDMEGKTYDEISVITGIREGTVKSTLARARKKLRNSLRDMFP